MIQHVMGLWVKLQAQLILSEDWPIVLTADCIA